MTAKTAKKTVKSPSKKTSAAKGKPAPLKAKSIGKKAVVVGKKALAGKAPIAQKKKQSSSKISKVSQGKVPSKKQAPKKTIPPKPAPASRNVNLRQTKKAAKGEVSHAAKPAVKSGKSAKQERRIKTAANQQKKAQVDSSRGKSALTAKKIVKKSDKNISKKTASLASKPSKDSGSKTNLKASVSSKKLASAKKAPAKPEKKAAVSAKRDSAKNSYAPKLGRREDNIPEPVQAKQAKPEISFREPIESLPTKKRGKNHVRSSDSIAFTIEDLDAYLARKENGNPISVTRDISVSKKRNAKDAKYPVAVPKPELKKPSAPSARKPLEPASIFDILGFNPVEAPTREKLEEKDVPRKWKKYYNLLIDLRKHHSAGVEKRSEEVLKRSVKEDSGDLSSYGQHLADAGSESFERDMTYNILSNEKETLAEIDEAIKRIKNGTYGICEVTGKPIPDDRLSAIPFTRYTKEGQERKELEQKRIKASQRNLYDIPENGVGGEDDSSSQ